MPRSDRQLGGGADVTVALVMVSQLREMFLRMAGRRLREAETRSETADNP